MTNSHTAVSIGEGEAVESEGVPDEEPMLESVFEPIAALEPVFDRIAVPTAPIGRCDGGSKRPGA